MVWGAIGAIGASALSGLFNHASAHDAAQQSLQNSLAIQQYQNAFTTKMSNTAHQREVEDLRKAGLNPLLSATGGSGASTPSAGSATLPGFDAKLGDSVASALDFLRYKNEKELKDSTKEVNASSVRLNDDLGDKARADANSAREFADYTNTQNDILETYGPLQEMMKLEDVANQIETRTATSAKQIEVLNAQIDNFKADTWRKKHQALGYSESYSESDGWTDTKGKGVNAGNTSFGAFGIHGSLPGVGINKNTTKGRNYSRSRSRTW